MLIIFGKWLFLRSFLGNLRLCMDLLNTCVAAVYHGLGFLVDGKLGSFKQFEIVLSSAPRLDADNC